MAGVRTADQADPDGRVGDQADRAVRTSARAFERLVEYLGERQSAGADGWVVQHIQAPEEAARMVDRGRDIFGSDPVFVSEIGPVIGTHVGPGLLGVGGIPLHYLA